MRYGMLNPRRRPTTLVELVLALVMLPDLALPWLVDHYGKTCPTQPNPEQGIIYPLRDHRTVLYLTLAQDRKVEVLKIYMAVSVPCLFAFGIWKYGLRPRK
jgi:hypothetical protein